MQLENDAAEQEFDVVMAKEGVAIPADRRSGTLLVYRDMRRMVSMLRQPRTPANEPSNTYSLVPFLRKS